jgi:hypothetical protein
MMKWEYKAEYWDDVWALKNNTKGEICLDEDLHLSKMVERLNELGADGWELINEVDFFNAQGYFLLKRPITISEV